VIIGLGIGSKIVQLYQINTEAAVHVGGHVRDSQVTNEVLLHTITV